MNFLRQAYSEAGGKPSSHRLLVSLFVLDVLCVWTINTIKRPEWAMDPTMLLALVSALGIGAWRRGRENPQKETKETKGLKPTEGNEGPERKET